ncbi:MAG: lipoyl(octanoyl) transferase LipB [Tepidisphaeraceae bacterium]|jgi:lipoyl(octanoyl) transferase
MPTSIVVNDLGRMPYRGAWDVQERAHQSVVAGGPETILIVEHSPVITLGRRAESIVNLISSPEELARRNIDLVHSDRGGDITFHGPGQIVAYPIIRLADHRLSVGGYVHRLEAIVIATLTELGIQAETDPKAVGIWTLDGGQPAKICAIGVRIRRGVTLHGLALNVAIDLSGFAHIVPCGLENRGVTSIAKILGAGSPSLQAVKENLIRHLIDAFGC